MKLIIIGIITLNGFMSHNVGIAQNEHFIQYPDKTGYYIENELDIRKGDKILIVNDEVYVIDREIK